MLVDTVTSRQNPLVKRFKAVRQGRKRHLVFIEGVRLVEEAIKSRLHFEVVAFSDRLKAHERGSALQRSLNKVNCRGAHVSEAVMESISDVESPQGIAAIVHLPYTSLETLPSELSVIVVAHRLRDPGNMGTLIRTAEAAGADSLIATSETVDPFNIKSLRAAMGSAFRLPIVVNTKLRDVAQLCSKRGILMVAAESGAETRYTDFDWTRPVALLLGQEAEGLDKEASSLVQHRVSIPMQQQVDSLNVASAGAVLLFEAARQRNFCKMNGVKGEAHEVDS